MEQTNMTEILPIFYDEELCRTRSNKFKKCEHEAFPIEEINDKLNGNNIIIKDLINQQPQSDKKEDPIDKLCYVFNKLGDNRFPKQYIPARYNISKGITDELFHKTEIEVNFETVKMSLWKACSLMEQVKGVKK